MDDRNLFTSKIKQFIKEIDATYPVDFGYLFGSKAKGTENKLSDIDIALMFRNKYDPNEDVFIRGDIIEMGKKYFNEQVDITSLDMASLVLRYSIVQEGILIKDDDMGRRAEFESLTLREYFDFKYYSDFYNQAIISKIKNGNYFRG